LYKWRFAHLMLDYDLSTTGLALTFSPKVAILKNVRLVLTLGSRRQYISKSFLEIFLKISGGAEELVAVVAPTGVEVLEDDVEGVGVPVILEKLAVDGSCDCC